MANFQSAPRGDRISGQTLIVAPPSVTVGVWGYLACPGNEVLVTSSDPAVRVTRGGIIGNFRLWGVTGAAGQQARLEAGRVAGGVWDSIEVHFRAGHHASGGVEVRPILAQLTGSAGTNNLIPATLPLHFLMRESTFRPVIPRTLRRSSPPVVGGPESASLRRAREASNGRQSSCCPKLAPRTA
jgi:hypothetical protein